MDEKTRRARELDAPEAIAVELWRLRVLQEHELGVRLEYDPDGGGPYVPEAENEQGSWAGVSFGAPAFPLPCPAGEPNRGGGEGWFAR
jgi:hypothetical protein